MDLEDKICVIIKDEYDRTGFHDDGRSDSSAHQIIYLLIDLGYLNTGEFPGFENNPYKWDF